MMTHSITPPSETQSANIPISRPNSTQLELWRDVLDYEGIYEVSSLGRVRRIKTGLVLRGCSAGNYPFVVLCNNGIQKNFKTHRLVAEAFFGRRPEGMEVNHIDGNKRNNCLSNLEYITHQENISHALANGLITSGTPKDIQLSIREMYESADPHYTLKQISEKFKISKDTVARIVNGDSLLLQQRGMGYKVTREYRSEKLSHDDHDVIRYMVSVEGCPQIEVARKYGVSATTISRIMHNLYLYSDKMKEA